METLTTSSTVVRKPPEDKSIFDIVQIQDLAKRKDTLVQIIRSQLSGDTTYDLRSFSVDILRQIEAQRETDNSIHPDTIKAILARIPPPPVVPTTSGSSSSSSVPSAASIRGRKPPLTRIPNSGSVVPNLGNPKSGEPDPKVGENPVEVLESNDEEEDDEETETSTNPEEKADEYVDGEDSDDSDDDDEEEGLLNNNKSKKRQRSKYTLERPKKVAKTAEPEPAAAAAGSTSSTAHLQAQVDFLSRQCSRRHVLLSRTHDPITGKDCRGRCMFYDRDVEGCKDKEGSYCKGCSKLDRKIPKYARYCPVHFSEHFADEMCAGFKIIDGLKK